MATGEEKTKWNGSLSFDSLLASSELFDIQLDYPGKKTADEILNTEPAPIITAWQATQTTLHHSLWYGNNLPILAHLATNMSLKGNIQLIYIDPPFATNKVYKSRSRQDAYHDLLDGAAYLEFLRERLIWLRELLAEDGSIYIHLDAHMIFHVKILMDEIFGRANFRNLITRRKCNPKNYTRNQYGNVSDYILFYTKSDTYTWNRPYEAWSAERARKEYAYIDKETGRRYKKVPIHAPGERNGATGQPWRGIQPPPGKHWQYTPETLDDMDARGEIYWSATGNPRRKIYLDESAGIPVQDLWLDVKDAHNQNIKITGYPTEKPLDLLKRIIAASSQPGDFVLDCFAGSGTTLQAATELNRSWIGIDHSLEAIKTMLQRFVQGLEPMGDFVSARPQTHQQAFPLAGALNLRDVSIHTMAEGIDDLNAVIQTWQHIL